MAASSAQPATGATVAGAEGGPAELGIDVLGPLTVRLRGTVRELKSSLVRTMLGLFAAQPGRVVSHEEIVDVLWGDDPPRTCLAMVHSYVAQVRRILESGRGHRGAAQLLRHSGAGYRLDLESEWLDLSRFDELVRQARRARAGGDDDAAMATP